MIIIKVRGGIFGIKFGRGESLKDVEKLIMWSMSLMI